MLYLRLAWNSRHSSNCPRALAMLLPLPLKCWHYKHKPPCMVEYPLFLRCTILSLDKQYVSTTQTIKYRIFSSPKSICLPQTSQHLHPFPRGNHWSDSVPIILSSLEWEKWIIQSNQAFVPGTYHNAFELHVAYVFSCIAECVCVLQSAVWGVRQGLSCSVTQAGFELQDTWGETYQLGTVLHKLAC